MDAGIELMFVGMGTVFGFLFFLVVVMSGVSHVVRTWFPEAPESAAVSQGNSGGHELEAAVAVAVAWAARRGE